MSVDRIPVLAGLIVLSVVVLALADWRIRVLKKKGIEAEGILGKANMCCLVIMAACMYWICAIVAYQVGYRLILWLDKYVEVLG
jgi:hypothetical protein